MEDWVEQSVGREKIVDKGFLLALGSSYAFGFGLGAVGRVMEHEWVLPVIPVGADVFSAGD